MCVFKKIKITLAALTPVLFSGQAFPSTSLTVSGHAGIVGQYESNVPPANVNYFGFRVPIGLTLEADPTDNLNIYLGFDYAYNNYPGQSVLLGQTKETSTSNNYGTSTPLPFSNTTGAHGNKVSTSDPSTTGSPFNQKTDTPTLTTAYFTYQTPVGLLKAGRMPHNWGLGIWYNTDWTPTNGSISTSDAIAFLADLSLFDVTIYYQRYGQGVGGTSTDGTAVAYTGEARLKTDPADVPSSGATREFGISYTKFDHDNSGTSLNIMDTYGKFYLSKYFIGGEVLYPSGETSSPNYQNLGGGPSCSAISAGSSEYRTCNSENVSSLAALLKFKVQLGGGENSTLAAIDASQNLVGTAERVESHTLGLWVGYASGGENQFYSSNDPIYGLKGNNISAITMNSNIQPSFLMFNNATPAINGMPTNAITNATFVRANYTYESPGFGSITPVLVWGRLNRTNPNYESCAEEQKVVSSTDPNVASNPSPTSSVNHVCVGGSAALGFELDLTYEYTTLDRVHFGVDAGYWAVGNAWQVNGQGKPNGSMGARLFTGTEF